MLLASSEKMSPPQYLNVPTGAGNLGCVTAAGAVVGCAGAGGGAHAANAPITHADNNITNNDLRNRFMLFSSLWELLIFDF
jgi:hypothetical protein